MSVDNDAELRAEQLFQQYFRDASKLDDLGPLAELLHVDAVILHHLRGRCMGATSKALKGGNHMEVRRFGNLAQQLRQQAELADSRHRDPK